MGKTFFDEDYIPMRKRQVEEAEKKFNQQTKSLSGFKIRSKMKPYQQEYFNVLWDFALDSYTQIFIANANDESGNGKATVTFKVEDEKVIEYDSKHPDKAWESLKEEIYNFYLRTHLEPELPKVSVLKTIRDEIEFRIPLILNLLREKPRSRHIPAKVRYEVFHRDQGSCVVCGSNMNIEFDHIIPFSKGGSNSAGNIRILCQECNRKRSDNIEKY